MTTSSRFTMGQYIAMFAILGLLAGLGLTGLFAWGCKRLDDNQRVALANHEALLELTHIREQVGTWLVTIDSVFVEPEQTSGVLESSAIAQGRALTDSTQRLANTALLQAHRTELLEVGSDLQLLTKALASLHTERRDLQAQIDLLAAPLPTRMLSLYNNVQTSCARVDQLHEVWWKQFKLFAGGAVGSFILCIMAIWRIALKRVSNPIQRLVAELNTLSTTEHTKQNAPIAPTNLQALSLRYKSMANALDQAGRSNQILKAETNALLESIPAILIGLDPDGKIVLWNAAATQNFGLIPNQALTRSILEVPIPWVDRTTPQALLSETTRDDVRLMPEVSFTTSDGERRVLSVTTTPVSYGAQGNGILVLGTDTTEQRSHESRVRHSQKLESVGQLAAGIAHEINTPIQYVGDSIHFLQEAFDDMNAILGSYKELRTSVSEVDSAAGALQRVEEAEEEADLDLLEEEVPGAIQRAIEGVTRVANIVGAMKRFAHPGATNFAPADLNEAVRTTLTVANNELRYVAKVNQQLGSIPAVECDLGDINQVLLNLLVNAAHAIEEKSEGKGIITVRTRSRGDRVVIEISDTGCGIPDEAESNVFDPFFTTKEVGKGTGQGLAIAHTIICEKHGGRLTFDSVSGRGTTFYIELPVRQRVAA